jgi:uncharacterized metal-binding protein
LTHSPPDPGDGHLTEGRMLALSASAAAKVARQGTRGATLVTLDEIDALVCLAACAGLIHAEGRVAEQARSVLNIKIAEGTHP